jgi:hypothetical protein
VEAVEARPEFPNLVASPVVLERHMERLVEVSDPVTEELQRIQLHLVIGRRSQDLKVRRDRREETRRRHRALSI